MCEHYWQVDTEGQADAAGRRLIAFSCTKCAEKFTKLTARKYREIAAELDAQ